ncbi:MAG TPA: GyrI-like domain-containing protein, partial [Reyranella sp.]
MTCSIVTVDRQLTAVVRAKVPFAEIPKAQRSARVSVDAALPSLEAGPLGRPVTRFRTPAQDMLDMEIGTIVGRSFAGRGEIVPSDLPAGRAAHFQLKGPFDGMPGAWQTLFAWCKAEKLELAG